MGTSGYQLDPSLLPQYGPSWNASNVQFNPNAAIGGSPIYYGQQIGAAGDPSLTYSPDLSSNDPSRALRNAQNVTYNLGAGIDASTFQQQQQQQALYNQFGNAANTAYGQLAQQPGYSAGDAANIEQSDRINGAVTTPDQYASLNPTAAQQAGMMGNTASYSSAYNPSAINSTTADMASNMRGNVAATAQNDTSVLGQQQQSLGNALNNNDLGVSADYVANNSNVLNSTADRLSGSQDQAGSSLNSAINNPGLNTSADYARQAGMTDGEVQQTATQAATNVGLQSQAQKDSIARAAAAAGNASPLAVAAAQSRAGVQGMVATGDAVTDANLAARAQQRTAATGVQQTQLGAAQYQTGAQIGAGEYQGSLGSQNAQYEGNLAQSAVQQQENTRLAANQYVAGQQVNAANAVAGNQLQSNQYTGNQGLSAESAIGGQGLAGQQFNQNLGTNIAMSQDQANTQRASQLYGVQQGNTQYAQQSNYNQNMGAASALSGNYQTVANQALNGQQQYRSYLTGQQSQALGAQQTAQQQQIANYGTMSNGLNSNAANMGNYQLGKSQQSFTTNLGEAVGQGLGKTLTSPATYAGG